VLQSCLDDLLLKVLGVRLLRNPLMRLTAEDVDFLAPPAAMPVMTGTLLLTSAEDGGATNGHCRLASFLVRNLQKVISSSQCPQECKKCNKSESM
jgi:hypothetical protein